jgi:putative sterol carrier protein
MASEHRGQVLDDVFRRMSEHLDADKAKDIQTVVHWKVWDRPGGGYDHYEVVLDKGRCAVPRSPSREPAVTLKMKPADFLKLVSGNASGPAMFMTGKLKIDGDLMLAARLAGLFRIPSLA